VIHFVSGKGGVGKSSYAAALAWKLAEQGRKTLLVELGERSYYRHVFQCDTGHQPVNISTLLSLARWEGESCLREYLLQFIKVERLVNMFFENNIMKALVHAAPALKELALLGKITSGPRKIGPPMPYDDVVVDAYATGHFRALWRAPVGMAEAIPFGPMGDQSRSINEVMKDPALTRYHVVLLPESLPMTEGLELAKEIEWELSQKPTLILNRRLNFPLSAEEIRSLHAPPESFAAYLASLMERQESAEKAMHAAELKSISLPWLFGEDGAEKIREMASMLDVE
jgi:anion-transporting  ArsA/GET3 family ATPase